jgi:hypothetical protein
MKFRKKRGPIKKALLVGLNKYHPSLNADLKGCVNDVENMREILTNYFGFDPENIRVIIDDRARQLAIIKRLRWLLKNARAGDELVFHYSGHGSQVRDRNGDELNDQLDEILCPYDLSWNNPLTDDILASLFKKIPKEVFLTMICDSCHSGTMTRGKLGNPNTPRFLRPPFDIRARSLGRELPKNKMGVKQNKLETQNHILLSGCKDNQTSADAYINGRYQGAMTWAFTSTIRESPNLTWFEIHSIVVKKLNSYTQIPQLSGRTSLANRKVFGGK